MSGIPDWLAQARVLATSPVWKAGRPYYRTAMMAMHPVPRPGLGTMAVDQHWRLYYDPKLPERWSLEEIAGVLIHELEHLLRVHPARAGEREVHRWNVAADLEINDDLRKEGLPLPRGGVFPELFGLPEGLTAEEYYERLPQDLPPTGVDLAGKEAGEGDGEKANPLAGRDGSGATGKPASWEEPPPGKGDTPGLSQAEAEVLRREVAREALEHEKRTGHLPGSVRRLVEGLLRPRVDWRRELRSQIRASLRAPRGKEDYTYARANRRSREVILPGLVGRLPRVAVVVDTSGSISQEELEEALGEVMGILRTAPRERGLPVLAVDREVQAVSHIRRVEDVVLEGGGGTDMGRGLEGAMRLRPRPDVVVVLTDGHTPWPEEPPPGVRVVVALLGKNPGTSPGWARTVRVGEGEHGGA